MIGLSLDKYGLFHIAGSNFKSVNIVAVNIYSSNERQYLQ